MEVGNTSFNSVLEGSHVPYSRPLQKSSREAHALSLSCCLTLKLSLSKTEVCQSQTQGFDCTGKVLSADVAVVRANIPQIQLGSQSLLIKTLKELTFQLATRVEFHFYLLPELM